MGLEAASEHLVLKGIGGQDAVQRIKAFLAQARPENVIDAQTLSTDLDLSERVVSKVLDGYVEHGVMMAREMIRCPECGARAPDEEVRQAMEADDDYPCPGLCGKDLAADEGADTVTIYQLIDTPAC